MMLEALVGLEKMSILQCQQLAKMAGYNSCTFDLVGPKARVQCEWIDAYMGIFRIENEGLFLVADIQFATDVHCENLIPKIKKEEV